MPYQIKCEKRPLKYGGFTYSQNASVTACEQYLEFPVMADSRWAVMDPTTDIHKLAGFSSGYAD